MAYFIKNGNSYSVAHHSAIDISEKLPPYTFSLKKDSKENLYLERVEPFSIPSKIYGDTSSRATRILNTFNDRSSATGVLLAGEKGSGKTLLAKVLSVAAAESGYPTIIVNDDICGESFNQLIQNISQPAVVIFDEFEKIYDKEKQNEVLTLLDGVYPTKKLFILTCNNKYAVSEHMTNRPGRLFYMLEYKGLSEEFIREYCSDVLKDTSEIDMICKISTLFSEFNFDILKALVEEMNRYNEPAVKAIQMLNAKPSSQYGVEFKVTVLYKGISIPTDSYIYPNRFSENPLNQRNAVDVAFKLGEEKIEEEITVADSTLNAISKDGSSYIYVQGDFTVTCTRQENKTVDYLKLL